MVEKSGQQASDLLLWATVARFTSNHNNSTMINLSGTNLARTGSTVTDSDALPQRGGGNKKGSRQSFGSVRKLPSGRFQARYTGPDGREHKAPTTFETKRDAGAWLSTQQADITRRTWLPGVAGRDVPTLEEYATGWLEGRDLKPRTRSHYADLLDRLILPTLGPLRLQTITPEHVEDWHRALGTATPTYRAHAYGLLRTIMSTALEGRLISANPCHIRGGGYVKRRKRIEPATLDELSTIVEHLPDRYRAMILLATFCAMRFGELAELRRGDLDLTRQVVHITRGMTRVNGEPVIGSPKSEAGVRDVAIPPHLLPALEHHLSAHVAGRKDALLFPAADGSSHMATSSLYRVFYSARDAAGRPDLRFHDLRHTGAVLAAQAGATLAELMGRLGHSTAQAALRYQHAAKGRDAQIAEALSRMIEGTKE